MKHQNKLLWQLPLVTLANMLLFCALSSTPAQTVPQIAEKALAATVSLEIEDRNGVILGQGSGFFVRHNLIATNHHVIEGAAQGTAKLVNRNRTYTIEGFTAIDKINDLALLKVTVYGIKPLLLGNSDTVRVGETVYVAGNPRGLEGTFSDGIISSRRGRAMKERLQMTAPISPGSSGGPVLNSKGEVIGVSVSTYRGIDSQNLNFAIPSNYLKKLLARSETVKPFSQQSQSISAETYLLRGNEKYRLADYTGAIADYAQAIRLNPDYALAYYNRGVAKNRLGQHLAAIADFNTAIRLKTDFAEAYYNRGGTKSRLGQHLAAIADFNTAIRLKPDYADAYHSRGYAKAGLGKHFAAIADYDTTVQLNPDYALAYYNRGVAKNRLGQHLAAIADFDTAIRLKTDFAEAYYNRGVVKRKLGQYFVAIADFDTAIRLNPEYAKAYYSRGLARYFLGQYSTAIADYDTTIRLTPNYIHAYYNRGLAKYQVGQYSAAIADYDTAIRLKPDYAKAYHNRGVAKRKLGHLWTAKQDLRIALKLAKRAGNESLKARVEALLQTWKTEPVVRKMLNSKPKLNHRFSLPK